MSAFEQLSMLKETAKHTFYPVILQAINKRAYELQQEINEIKKLTVYICEN